MESEGLDLDCGVWSAFTISLPSCGMLAIITPDRRFGIVRQVCRSALDGLPEGTRIVEVRLDAFDCRQPPENSGISPEEWSELLTLAKSLRKR